MRLFTTLFSASIVAMVIGGQLSTPLDMQDRALQQHLVQVRTGSPHLSSAAGSRMIRKRGSSAKNCKSKKGKKTGSSSSSHSSGHSSSNSDSHKSSSSEKHSKGDSIGDEISSSIGKGLQGLTFAGNCKDPKADDEYPNGRISFLNCGLSKSNPSSKWSPPKIKMNDLKTVSVNHAVKSSVFKPCSQYKSDFEKAEKSTGIPAVMLMSFAMQESTCNPSATGGNGEVGMMQLTPDKCHGANCHDAGTNIMMGAKYFKSEVDRFNGNVLEALGAYNGWSSSMSYSSATSKQYGCNSQNNLDYLNQFLNAWMQGKDGHSKAFLVYNNLGSC